MPVPQFLSDLLQLLFDLAVPDAPEWVMQALGHVGDRRTMLEASLAFSEGGVALRVPAAAGVKVTGSVHELLAATLPPGNPFRTRANTESFTSGTRRP